MVTEFVETLTRYGVRTVTGDRYGGEWPREVFAKHGVHYVPAERTKSELYGACLPLINSGRCALLDHERFRNQLLALERRVSRQGKDSIDHPPGAHDDLANAAAGALVEAAKLTDYYVAAVNLREVPRERTDFSDIRGRP